jgi:3-methyladenine DNA glycosylase AlkD
MGGRPVKGAAAQVKAIRAHLEAHGSTEHAAGVQWFFKEEVRSYGWYTADLRTYARELHKGLSADPPLMLDVADRLFNGKSLEEKALAVVMVARSLPAPRAAARRAKTPPRAAFVPGNAEFARFVSWLDTVSTWADHDALAMFLIGPMLVAVPSRARQVHRWARSKNRWRRRAAAVSLIRGIQQGLFVEDATRVTRALSADPDDMVQKGLGWLLRVWGSVRPAELVPLLVDIRPRTSRLVLRTACERLPAAERERVLARTRSSS